MSTAISASLVKELRDRTGAGMMDCKRALADAGGDLEEATKALRAKGLADAAKRAGRAANEGLGDECAALYYRPGDDVPEEEKAEERAIYEEQARDVPEHARAKAVEGKLAKHLRSICLLEQEYVRDQGEKRPRTIEELRAETSGSLGENVTIRRFTVFELGQ